MKTLFFKEHYTIFDIMNLIFLESNKSWIVPLWDLNNFWLISDQLWISDQDETSAGFLWSWSEVSLVHSIINESLHVTNQSIH